MEAELSQAQASTEQLLWKESTPKQGISTSQPWHHNYWIPSHSHLSQCDIEEPKSRASDAT